MLLVVELDILRLEFLNFLDETFLFVRGEFPRFSQLLFELFWLRQILVFCLFEFRFDVLKFLDEDRLLLFEFRDSSLSDRLEFFGRFLEVVYFELESSLLFVQRLPFLSGFGGPFGLSRFESLLESESVSLQLFLEFLHFLLEEFVLLRGESDALLWIYLDLKVFIAEFLVFFASLFQFLFKSRTFRKTLLSCLDLFSLLCLETCFCTLQFLRKSQDSVLAHLEVLLRHLTF